MFPRRAALVARARAVSTSAPTLGVLLVALALSGSPAAAQDGPPEPIRLAVGAFGTDAEVEVRDLPEAQARAAAEAALAEIYEVHRLADPDGDAASGIGALNRSAGHDGVKVDPRVAELLLRAQQFCIWSSGAYGPLGGSLHQVWAARPDPQRPPPAALLRDAVGTAECSRLILRAGSKALDQATAALVAGSRVDVGGLGRGLAVDRAIAVLREKGVTNAWVEIGPVRRALGAGPDGRGWFAALPAMKGAGARRADEPLDEVWLRDQSLVVFTVDRTTREPDLFFIDQRTGVPARGVLLVAVVTERAVDAEPLALSLFLLGHREGQMRLGTLSPRPAVYWLLGEGYGQPLEATYHWSEVERVRR